MFNPLTTRAAEIHQADMTKAAQEQRKALSLAIQKVSLRRRILLQLGDLLIAAGSRLHERYEAQICADPEPC